LGGVLLSAPAGGSYPVTVTGTDDYGFTATASATVVITAPDAPPVVTTSVSPGAPDGKNGWYVSGPTLSAAATGDTAGAAPSIQYKGGGGDWTPYSAPLAVPDGNWTYQFRATDGAGVTSAPVSVPVRVDRTAPSTTASFAPGATIIAPVTVTLAATDAVSGVAGTQYQVGSGAWTDYTAPFAVPPTFADQTVSFRSTDVAGNVKATSRLTIPAITPIAPTITTTATTPQYGTAATVLVTVSSPGLPAAGTVTLTEGTTPRGTATLAADGTATFTLPVGLAAGNHVLSLGYSGSDLLTPAYQTLVVTVGLPPAWSASAVYNTGAKVSYKGNEYVASYYTKNEVPGSPTGAWQEILLTEAGTAQWTPSRIFNAGDLAVYNGKTFKADWYTRDQTPGDVTGPWEEQAPAGPNGIAPWTPTTVYHSGDQVTYQGGTYRAQWYTRNQAPGASGGPWKKVG